MKLNTWEKKQGITSFVAKLHGLRRSKRKQRN